MLREVELVADKTIDREDYCPKCAEPMYYRVAPGSETVVALLCGNLMECSEALKELPPEPRASRRKK